MDASQQLQAGNLQPLIQFKFLPSQSWVLSISVSPATLLSNSIVIPTLDLTEVFFLKYFKIYLISGIILHTSTYFTLTWAIYDEG